MVRMTLLALLAAAMPAPAQDRPGRTRSSESVFSFEFKQGWTIRAGTEQDLVAVDERELTRGIAPRLFIQRRDPNDPATRPAPRRRDTSPPAGRPVRPSVIQTHGDPIAAEGTLTLPGDGSCRLSFTRLEYSDDNQRWWIDFSRSKIRAFKLGGRLRWSGTREEWKTRLSVLELACLAAYLKAVTPQTPERERPTIRVAGLTAKEPGLRLFVTSCLEEQLVALLLARINGASIEGTLWPAEVAVYPRRVILMARSIVERLLAQAAGEAAPKEARDVRSRAVKNKPWTRPLVAVPSFHWGNEAAWAVGKRKVIREAHDRLAKLSERLQTTGAISSIVWDNAVRRERDAIEKASAVDPLGQTPTVKDVLAPRSISAGKRTFGFKEKLRVEDGKVLSSEVKSYGLVRDWELAFFHSGTNRWRTCRIRFDIWYRGEVKRQ